MQKVLPAVLIAGAVSLCCCSLAFGETGIDKTKFSWGGDLRARVANFDRIPKEDGKLWAENRYFRFRTRVWGKYAFNPDISFATRLTNEWRTYDKGKGANQYKALDEFVFDNFYLDVNNLLSGRLDLRVGRQDMRYGTGKVILLSTPLDSSRTYYFNAVKGRLKYDRLKVDLFATYNENEDEFVINGEDRALIEDGVSVDGSDAGGGIYVMNDRFARLPQEYYYVYKHEELSGAQTDLDLHTFGVRFMPRFTDSLSANVEAAFQDGDRENGGDVAGELFDVSLFYNLPFWQAHKPVVDLSYYYLSGDDPNTTKEEGWHPVWARFPQYMSYTIVRAAVNGRTDFASWTNISMPSIGLRFNLGKNANLKLRLAQVYAPEEGAGGGKEKGALFISRLTCKINEQWDTNMHVEVFDADHYYANINGYAHYVHFDVMFHF